MQPQYIMLPLKAKDITGLRSGRLIALGPIKHERGRHVFWLCQCECGNTAEVDSSHLRSGHTTSCGCRGREKTILRNTTHGMKDDPLYETWSSMIKRCYNQNSKNYHNYGGRGIAVCDEWRHDFKAFYDHVSRLPHWGEEGYSLDRADNSLGYFPGNVRWAVPLVQARNSRHALPIEFRGKSQCLTAWADELGISSKTLRSRLFRGGWSIERAFTTSTKGT